MRLRYPRNMQRAEEGTRAGADRGVARPGHGMLFRIPIRFPVVAAAKYEQLRLDSVPQFQN